MVVVVVDLIINQELYQVAQDAGGSAFVGCGGFTGTITVGGTGGNGENGGTGGDWGENGANTVDSGDGGTAGKAIDRSTNVISWWYNKFKYTVKGIF